MSVDDRTVVLYCNREMNTGKSCLVQELNKFVKGDGQ